MSNVTPTPWHVFNKFGFDERDECRPRIYKPGVGELKNAADVGHAVKCVNEREPLLRALDEAIRIVELNVTPSDYYTAERAAVERWRALVHQGRQPAPEPSDGSGSGADINEPSVGLMIRWRGGTEPIVIDLSGCTSPIVIERADK